MGLAAGIDLFDVSQHRHLFLGVIISPHVSDPAHRKLQAHKDDEEQCQSDNLAASQPAAGIQLKQRPLPARQPAASKKHEA